MSIFGEPVIAAEPERKGWVCQKCGRSYAPTTPACSPCNDAVTVREKAFGRRRQIVQIKRKCPPPPQERR